MDQAAVKVSTRSSGESCSCDTNKTGTFKALHEKISEPTMMKRNIKVSLAMS